MKKNLLTLLLVALYSSAWAQMGHPAANPGRALYREANTSAAIYRLRTEISQHENDFLNKGAYQTGYLRTLDGHRILVIGLRYHMSQRVVQVQDSMQADSTHYWPLAAVRGFDLGAEDDATVRRYRTRLVQDGHQGAHREAVEVLTATDAGPLLLAWLPTVAEPEVNSLPLALLAGPGTDPTQPLRPLELTQAAVLRLCGSRAAEVRTFATTYHLHYDQPIEAAKMLDYYNRIAVAR